MFAKLKAELVDLLSRKIERDVEIIDLEAADGHSGLTFLFTVRLDDKTKSYVIRLTPKGVRREGNTDIYRQVPLLNALYDAGFPVPRIKWASQSDEWFGGPYIIMEQCPGRTFHNWRPDVVFTDSPAGIDSIWKSAASLLAKLHTFDWKARLPAWESPRSLLEEIRFWGPIFQHAPDARWIELGKRLQLALEFSIPSESRVGLVHGDYQPGNILFDASQNPLFVIDWELSHIGAQGLDLGWLMMMADPLMWDSRFRTVCSVATEDLVDCYRASLGSEMYSSPLWYEALAGYRFGSIACLNLMLHRRGKRHDPMWEKIALSIPYLFGHSLEVIKIEAKSRQ